MLPPVRTKAALSASATRECEPRDGPRARYPWGEFPPAVALPTSTLTRRYFRTAASVAGAGFPIGIQSCSPKSAVRGGEPRLNKWVAISPDGTVHIRTTRVDMGQGSQTGLAQIVADEMDADWSKVEIEMAPVTEEYLDQDGEYLTGGSQSIRFDGDAFAEAGAAARAMLIAAAAKRWSVAAHSLTTKNSKV